MIPVVGSLTNLGLLILGFVIGFIAKTVLPYEYKRFRRQSAQSKEEVKQWNRETLELLGEVRTLSETLEYDKDPNLKEKSEKINDIRTKLMKHQSRAPDGAPGEVVENLMKISTEFKLLSSVYTNYYTNFPGFQESSGQIPSIMEFDSKVNDEGHLVLTRKVRKKTHNTLHDRVYPLADEIEEELNQSED